MVGWLGSTRPYHTTSNPTSPLDVEVADGRHVKVPDGVRKLVIPAGWEREEIKTSYPC